MEGSGKLQHTQELPATSSAACIRLAGIEIQVRTSLFGRVPAAQTDIMISRLEFLVSYRS